MDLLLDTCTFLWYISDAKTLSQRAKIAIQDRSNRVFLSSVSAWEMTIKHALGKLPLPSAPDKLVIEQRVKHLIDPLPFDESAAVMAGKLPDYHRDPFDRMLVCQALASKLIVVSPDAAFDHYPIDTLW